MNACLLLLFYFLVYCSNHNHVLLLSIKPPSKTNAHPFNHEHTKYIFDTNINLPYFTAIAATVFILCHLLHIKDGVLYKKMKRQETMVSGRMSEGPNSFFANLHILSSCQYNTHSPPRMAAHVILFHTTLFYLIPKC